MKLDATIIEGTGRWRGALAADTAPIKLKDWRRQRPAAPVVPITESARMTVAETGSGLFFGIPPRILRPGDVIHATAVARHPNSSTGQVFNVDALEGGIVLLMPDGTKKQIHYGVRCTIPGSNATEHYPDFIGLQSPMGIACSSWAECPPNSLFTWVCDESIELLLSKGPNGYKNSRT